MPSSLQSCIGKESLVRDGRRKGNVPFVKRNSLEVGNQTSILGDSMGGNMGYARNA